MTIVAIRPSMTGTSGSGSAGTIQSASAVAQIALLQREVAAAETARPVAPATQTAAVADDSGLRQESVALLAALTRLGPADENSVELSQLRDRTEAYLAALRPVAAAELASRGRQMIVLLSQGSQPVALPAAGAPSGEAAGDQAADQAAARAAESAALRAEAARQSATQADRLADSRPSGADPDALFAARRLAAVTEDGLPAGLPDTRAGGTTTALPERPVAIQPGSVAPDLPGVVMSSAESVVRAQAVPMPGATQASSAPTGAAPLPGLMRAVAGVATGLWLAVAAYSATAGGWAGA
ncbi:hypothetical protein [Frigidibacter sp. MR17.24]|uniref:hypothetical protein n=1 Tax=Frigidibacter sp. MR17.24 TaxID=3127345 RepID=UPI003012D34E